MRSWAIFPFLTVCLAASGQDSKDTPWLTVTQVTAGDGDYRVKLYGRVKAADGDKIALRISPVGWRLNGDKTELVAQPQDGDTISCGVEVSKGSFTTEFILAHLFEYEVSIQWVSGAGAKLTTEIFVFDEMSAEKKLKAELAKLDEHTRTLDKFISEMEPFAKDRKRVPSKMRDALQKVDSRMRYWSSTTDLSGAAWTLTGVIEKIYDLTPWEQGGDPLPAVPYERPKPPDPNKFDIAALKAMLPLARRVALQESLLKVLRPLENTVAALLNSDEANQVKRTKKTARILRELFDWVKSGPLSDLHEKYPLAKDLESLIADVNEALQKLPESEPLNAETKKTVKELDDRLNASQKKVQKFEK